MSGERPVFTDKLHELAGFVHVKAEIEFRILSEECLTFRTVSLAKRFPNGVEDIQQESWAGSRRCFEANAGFSGYPTKQLGWKGLKASFFVPPKTFSRNKTAVSDAFGIIQNVFAGQNQYSLLAVLKVPAGMKYSVPIYKAGSGYSILTEECLNSRTRLPSTPTIQVNTESKIRLKPTRCRPRRTDRP